MHGDKLTEKALRSLTLRRMGIKHHVRRITSTQVQAMGSETNLQDLPPADLNAPTPQLPSGRPVFVVGIDSADSDAWIL